ncbi:UpxY family transcription antiterminator [Ilyomonas limi]|uniref:UpxY family transcription antiterminator n=1 Tax=Ilyomonas limi TaxID=2575867 RepID=A0A4U3KWG2_9BACT|nr:UpxY family transcription antiterminator [Ilyomonas limi]TKK65994.1 UpxY family transcription antiterminator [Ilyomonas limi]
MAENEKHWYAVYTRPRSEKRVDTLLQKKFIESWCPLQKVVRQWSDRKKTILQPLFTSYVFVHVTGRQRIEVLQTDGVLNYVHYLGKPAIIKDEEIQLIKSYLQEGEAAITTQSWESLEEDIKVQITQGVFIQNTGTIIKSGKKTLYVRLESLGQVMVVEFPVQHVKSV